MMSTASIYRYAAFSECGTYRYMLLRAGWLGTGELVWVMLNPSTADDFQDDPTIRRVMGFTQREGYETAVILNLFALRSTDPKLLRSHAEPVGPANDAYIAQHASRQRVVAAWGAHEPARAAEALSGPLAEADLYCLGLTKDGYPRHPLYVRSDQPLIPYPKGPA